MNRSLMLREAAESPQVISRQLALNAERVQAVTNAMRERQPAFGVTVARGSSDHACTVLKYGLETHLGLPVASLGPSVHTLYARPLRLQRALVLAVSQSGASPDVVETLAMARHQGAMTVALVNQEESPLAEAAEFVLPLQCGPERAVAATKSYLAGLTAFLPVVAHLSSDAALSQALQHLPKALSTTLQCEDTAAELSQRYRFADSLIILARGLHYGVAQEAALKLKETSGVHAEAYSAAEFSHGPKRLLAEGMPLLGFSASDASWTATEKTYLELRQAGADLRTLGPVPGSDLPTDSTGHPLTDTVTSALAFYLFAAHLAVLKGLDPDRPPLLSKVTLTV